MFYLLIYDSLVDNRLNFGLFLRSALCLRFGLYWVFGLCLLSWNHLTSLVCESINTPDCVSGTYVAKNASTRRKKTWSKKCIIYVTCVVEKSLVFTFIMSKLRSTVFGSSIQWLNFVFDGDERKYELWEAKILGYLKLKG